MSDQLPQSWCECSLEDVGEIVTGNTPPKNNPANYGDKYPWAKPPDLGSDAPILKTPEYLSEQGAKLARLLPPSTTLVSCIGRLGKVGFAGTTLATNQQINSLIFDTRIVEPRYGFHYCKTLHSWMESNFSSTTVPIINKGRFSEAPFLLAPLPEQQRIVEKLEKLLNKLDACQKRLANVPNLLKRFRQSVLAAACSGKLTEDWRESCVKNDTGHELLILICADRKLQPNSVDVEATFDVPKSWAWTTLENLLRYESGLAYGILKPGDFIQNGIPMLRVMDIGDGRFNSTKLFCVSKELAEEYRRTRLEAGDVLLAVMATVGRSVVVPPFFEGANVNRALAVIKFTRYLNPNFACAVIRSPFFQDRFASEKVGSAQQRINLTDLRQFPFPVPPLAEQQEIVRRVEVLFALADKTEQRYQKAQAFLDKLTPSLLAKAFRGELVPQDPNDEPASLLLERIKAERDKGNKLQSRKR